MAEKAKSDGGVVETIKTVVYALLIAGVFRTLFFQPFWIPSGSMKDTLLIGDFLFVNKMTYGYSYASCPSIRIPRLGVNVDAKDICGWLGEGSNERLFGGAPERGDVVVFRHPTSGADFIKRLIGLPGDQVQMIEGVLHINGVAVKREDGGVFREEMEEQGPQRTRPRCQNGPVGDGGICAKSRIIETLPNGVSYSTLDRTMTDVDNTGIYNVPEGKYFFMGDNRDNSSDSRVPQSRRGVGYVPYENLIGRADRIMFSSAGNSMFAFWTWRGDRFFEAVK